MVFFRKLAKISEGGRNGGIAGRPFITYSRMKVFLTPRLEIPIVTRTKPRVEKN